MKDCGLYMRGSGRPVTDWSVIRGHVLQRDNWTCYLCGKAASQVDHVWPRRWGGDDHVDNLRAICPPCNKAKGDRIDLGAADGSQLRLAIDAARRRAEAALCELDRFLEEMSVRGDARSLESASLSLHLFALDLSCKRDHIDAARERINASTTSSVT